MRSRFIFAVLGASLALASCDALFGFRDLEVEPDDGEEGGGGVANVGGEGGMSSDHGGGGFGAYGGFGGGFGAFGGFGGGACGVEDIGTACSDDLECASCTCELGGDDGQPMEICCHEECLPCYDCDPTTGFCTIEIEGEDPGSCEGQNFCYLGTCQSC